MDSRPLVLGNGVHGSVAQGAITHHHVIAQHAIKLGAEFFNSCTGLGILLVGAQLHGIALEYIEGIAEHEQLGFRVDGGPLIAGGHPGRTNLNLEVF